MPSPRFLRPLLLLALGFACSIPAAHAAGDAGFSGGLSAAQQAAAGLDQLSADELATIDLLVAGDLATARQLRTTTFGETFSSRHDGQQAGLDRLSAEQRAQFDELVADAIAAQPLPKDRPRLKDNEVVSLQRRLEVHGGMSFTLGWASGGRNYREAGAWVSYFDPQTGLGLAVAFSQGSGDAIYPYGGYYYPGSFYGYDRPGWYNTGFLPGNSTDVELFWVRPNFSLSIGFSQDNFKLPDNFYNGGRRGAPVRSF